MARSDEVCRPWLRRPTPPCEAPLPRGELEGAENPSRERPEGGPKSPLERGGAQRRGVSSLVPRPTPPCEAPLPRGELEGAENPSRERPEGGPKSPLERGGAQRRGVSSLVPRTHPALRGTPPKRGIGGKSGRRIYLHGRNDMKIGRNCNVKKIAVLTGGGDAPGLNAVIRSVYKTAEFYGMTTYGIRNGFRGLVEGDIFPLRPEQISGILPRGGTILGTTNRDNPFNFAVEEKGTIVYKNVSPIVIENVNKLGIEALVVIGGDGTLSIASEISDMGVPIMGVPKTIDNDISYTERTFGYDSALSVATDALDRLHTTAEAHHRCHVLEVMGRYAGWVALESGIAGGADCILIPEIPFSWELIVNKINTRKKMGKLFSIIVVAEGAKSENGELLIARIVTGGQESIRLGGIGDKVADEVEKRMKIESRATVLGHLQRGGSPTAYDRVLATRYGEAAVTSLVKGQINKMVALQHNQIISVDLKMVVGKPHVVPKDHELVKTGRAIGVCFGDY